MSEDHRQHIRLNISSRVFIDLAGPPLPGDDTGEILLCKTLDISYSGLQISLARELTVGALLHIGVEFPGLEQPLHLVSEVKWCRQNQPPAAGWAVGLQLLNSTDSDTQQWQELMLHA